MRLHFWMGIGAAHKANRLKFTDRRSSLIVAVVLILLAVALLAFMLLH